MASIHLADAELNTLDVGSGPILLLVHGFPLDHSMWRRQVEAFRASHRVLAPDLRGFGKSGGAGEVTMMEQFADDLAELLDGLGISDPVHFCGLSMGGYIAWQFWKRHGFRLRSLILCDTRAQADSPEAAQGRLQAADKVMAEGAAGVAESMLPKLFWEQTRQAKADFVEETHQVMLATSPTAIAAALRGMAQRPDMTSELAEIKVPSLLLCGEHDVISTVNEMQGIAASMPRAEFTVIPDAGHMAPLENATATNAAIRGFLDSLPATC